MLDRAIQR